MTMLIKLENYYRECGIWPAAGNDFRCRHLDACRNGMKFTPLDATKLCQARNTFTPGHSAMVGARYEESSPRLLFVALDLGTVLRNDDEGYTYVKPETRAPLGLRRSHERMMGLIVSGKDKARRPTLKRTNQFAEALLCNLPGFPEKKGGDFIRFCVRVNAAKCTMNKKQRAQAANRLYDNCRECGYLRGEIEILSPDIIVSLGKMAKLAVESAFSTSSEWTQEKVIHLPDNKKALWLPVHHPRHPQFYPEARVNWGNGKGREWKKFAARVREFMSARAA